jgi:predicted AAA+ superfamily ATPase
MGMLLETYLFHELRAAVAYRNVGGSLFYWKTQGGTEVDFVWRRGDHVLGVEVKASTTWRPDYGTGLQALGELRKGTKTLLGVYRGSRELQPSHYRVLPAEPFLDRLSRGDYFG